MKKYIFLIIFFITIIDLYSQEKEILKKNKALNITEKITVLKSDNNIRQGSYEKYMDNLQLKQNTLIEKGQYSNNNKVGIWNYYDTKGNITLQYNFENDSIIIYNGIQVNGLKENRPLLYLGSSEEISNIVACGLKLPAEAYKLGQSGKVIVELHINEKGEVSEYTILNGINEPLNLEAIRVAKLIPISWLPAIKNGECIKSSKELPVTFFVF